MQTLHLISYGHTDSYCHFAIMPCVIYFFHLTLVNHCINIYELLSQVAIDRHSFLIFLINRVPTRSG